MWKSCNAHTTNVHNVHTYIYKSGIKVRKRCTKINVCVYVCDQFSTSLDGEKARRRFAETHVATVKHSSSLKDNIFGG